MPSVGGFGVPTGAKRQDTLPNPPKRPKAGFHALRGGGVGAHFIISNENSHKLPKRDNSANPKTGAKKRDTAPNPPTGAKSRIPRQIHQLAPKSGILCGKMVRILKASSLRYIILASA